MFISVLVTTYNAEKTIAKTLDSIASQSYDNYEVIVVDDGSEDETPQIVNLCKINIESIDISFFQPGRLGRGKALNYGVEKANGEWIAICDADDIWHPRKLEFQVQSILIKKNIDILATNTILFNDSEEIYFQNLNLSQDLNDSKISYIAKKDLLRSNLLSHSSVIIHRHLANYSDERTSQLDYALWLYHAFNDRKLAKLKINLTYHRIHEEQAFESKMGKEYLFKSFKLKIKYSFMEKNIFAIIYNVLKLIYDYILPRKLRMSIRSNIK